MDYQYIPAMAPDLTLSLQSSALRCLVVPLESAHCFSHIRRPPSLYLIRSALPFSFFSLFIIKSAVYTRRRIFGHRIHCQICYVVNSAVVPTEAVYYNSDSMANRLYDY